MNNFRQCDAPHCGICRWFEYVTPYSDGDCENPRRKDAMDFPDEGCVCDLFEEHKDKRVVCVEQKIVDNSNLGIRLVMPKSNNATGATRKKAGND